MNKKYEPMKVEQILIILKSRIVGVKRGRIKSDDRFYLIKNGTWGKEPYTAHQMDMRFQMKSKLYRNVCKGTRMTCYASKNISKWVKKENIIEYSKELVYGSQD